MKYTKEQFSSVLCDCKGFSKEDALSYFIEYNTDLEGAIRDMGGDDEAIREMKEFLNI